MGVTGLWQLLEPAGRPVSMASFETSILAIDVSLWIHQAVKGSSSHRGDVINPHLVTLFRRICKLLFHGIRPVLVFDGPNVPSLKRQTLVNRKLGKQVAVEKLNKLQKQMLMKCLKLSALRTSQSQTQPCAVLPVTTPDDRLFGSSSSQEKVTDISEDMFASKSPVLNDEMSEDEDDCDSTDSFYRYDVDDIDSKEFLCLPIQMQREILLDMSDRSRNRKVANSVELPQESVQFSQYQLDRLLSKNRISQRLQDIEKELNMDFVANANPDILDKFDPSTLRIRVTGTGSNADVLIRGDLVSQPSGSTVASNKSCGDSSKLSKEAILEDIVRESLDSSFEIETDCAWTESLTASAFDSASPSVCEPKVLSFLDDSSSGLLPCLDASSKCIRSTQNGTAQISSVRQSILHDIKAKLNSLKTVPNQPSASNCPIIEGSASSSDGEDFEEVEDIDIDVTRSQHQEVSSENSCSFVPVMQPVLPTVQEVPCCSKSMSPLASDRVSTSVDDSSLIEEMTPDDFAVESLVTDFVEDVQTTSYAAVESKLCDELTSLRSKAHAEEAKSKTVTQQLYEDCQECAKLFGVPFVVSPGEAEAQCAFLDRAGLTVGTITEDSDVWLFGGTRVYRHLFNHSRSAVESYRMEDISSLLGLSREQLIQIAMLTGCDYTEGIKGLGFVTAMEILSEFKTTSPQKSDTALSALEAFRWWQIKDRPSVSQSLSSVKARLARMKLNFPPSFPDGRVYQAFAMPEVDESLESFVFGQPDLEQLREFAEVKLNWTRKKTDEMLLPVMKKLAACQHSSQPRITSFMITLHKEGKTSPSKRVQRAAEQLRRSTDDDTTILSSPRLSQGTKLAGAAGRVTGSVSPKKAVPSTVRRGRTRPRKLDLVDSPIPKAGQRREKSKARRNNVAKRGKRKAAANNSGAPTPTVFDLSDSN